MFRIFFDRRTALGLTLAALISELWRGFLDAMFVLPIDYGDPATLQLASIIFTGVFVSWALALVFAWQGNRWATAFTFGLNLLILLAVPVGWLLFYCTAECRAEAGIFNLANSLNLVLGILAGVSLSGQLVQPRAKGHEQSKQGA